MSDLLVTTVMHILHILYTRCGAPIYFIRGTGKDYPKYLLYTEDEDVYGAMELF